MFNRDGQSENQWMSVSDLMAGLMIVFLFIAISYMIIVNKEKDRIKNVAVTYTQLQKELYSDLLKEFESDLKKWNAEIDEYTLSVRFKEPDVLFKIGSYRLKHEFKKILNDFIPRYIAILSNNKYKSSIEEIRIEGHTSSEGATHNQTIANAYIYNMKLSQDRTRSVLNYVLFLAKTNFKHELKWIMSHVTANGLSSSKVIRDVRGREDRKRSRRVEFRIKTNAQKSIYKILDKSLDNEAS